ncbi:MAG: Gfo/Idh/MocA family oxidoreductase [Chloroflexi bacterium]|nr:Gfo/Idh/MocA family oxidoreductase [Chloroflexota bacterium]
MTTPVRLAVVGGHRGGSFDAALEVFRDRVTLTTVCDLDDRLLAQWESERPGIKTYSDYSQVLDDPDIDAVLLATPMMLHARQAIDALDSGKHVLSEVIAATTLDECWELVEAVERTGLTYMMAENYCYRRETMMVLNMAEQGLFGDLTFAEGAYIHDCRHLLFNDDGTRTWRGVAAEGIQISRANGYPTHSLGPAAQWLGINSSDRLLRTTTFVTKSASRHGYAAALLGADHPEAQQKAWLDATDSASTLIETEHGRVISLRKDSASPRPHNMTHYGLQGNAGAFISARYDGEDPLVWIEGMSPGSNLPESSRQPEWQSLWALAAEYEHPRWAAHGDKAIAAGHGGGDFFVLEDFINAVLGEQAPAIDVYDAVTWSSITPLSAQSVSEGGTAVEVPDFRAGRARF